VYYGGSNWTTEDQREAEQLQQEAALPEADQLRLSFMEENEYSTSPMVIELLAGPEARQPARLRRQRSSQPKKENRLSRSQRKKIP
jgi:hypothetical protein